MKKITMKSRTKVLRLMKPPTVETSLDDPAPRGLTIRQLMSHARRARLRQIYTVAQIEGGGLVSLRALERCGFDYVSHNSYL